MITVCGKELQWKEGLTIQDLALQTGGAPGASFATIEASCATMETSNASAEAKPESARVPRARLVSRLEWPGTQVPDGVTIKFIIIPSGG